MFCSKCGAQLAEGVKFCSNCGIQTADAQPETPQVPPAYAPVAPEQTSGKAIASLVCGIINIFPLFVVAVILGHLSLSDIRKSGGRLKGHGLAVAGLVLGYLGVIFIPFILIVAAIAIPNLLRAKIAANEASAVGSVRELIAAEATYQTTHQDAGFTCSFSDLSGLHDMSLADGFKNGYTFFLQNCSAEKEGGPVSKFQITAIPKVPNTSGRRVFCSDESGVIRADAAGSAQDCLESGARIE
jgi:hypothetical protein